jgi:hypothetical protein
MPNIRTGATTLLQTDFEAIKLRRQVQQLTGSHIRNQCYFEGMIRSGVRGAGKQTAPPADYIAAVEAAAPWGKNVIPPEVTEDDETCLLESPLVLQDDIDAACYFLLKEQAKSPNFKALLTQ